MVKGILFTSLVILFACSGIVSAAEKKAATKENAKNTKTARSHLRCWQQGKLLFNEKDWHSFTIANKDNVLNFTKEKKDSQSLTLINMGETICLYQKTDSNLK